MPSQGRRNHPVRHPLAGPVDEHGTAIRRGPETPRANARRLAAFEEADAIMGTRTAAVERNRQGLDHRLRHRTLVGAR